MVYAGIIEKSPGGILKLGDVRTAHVLIPLIGVLVIAVLNHFKVKGAILIGIVMCTAIAFPFGIVSYHGIISAPPSIEPTLWKMNLSDALAPKYFPLILVFLFMALFDTIGTVVGVTQQAGLAGKDGSIPRLKGILVTDASASVIGAALGTSTIVTYIESSAGVQEGGRTGLTAVVTGIMFLLALFFEPLARMFGGGFSAKIDFSDLTETLPAFLTMIGMPLTYSIADGLAFGFISYPILKIFTGRIRSLNPLMAALGIIFILRYAFLQI
jgi:AGZA family xanthine/uracil permease-like MFS transporter